VSHSSGHRLDWGREGLSPFARRVALAVIEAIMSDEDDEGRLVPGRPEMCARAVDTLADTVGRGSADLRRGFAVLCVFMEWLPLAVIGAPSRMTRLPLARRVAYLEALEASRIGWLAMLLIAFKVPMCIPAFEEGEELRDTGFDRPSTVARRRLVTMGNAVTMGDPERVPQTPPGVPQTPPVTNPEGVPQTPPASTEAA
jgi:hypothetical protein